MAGLNLNRNSTPEVGTSGSLRPPSARTIGAGHSLRASADMAAYTSSPLATRIRPSSEVWQQQHHASAEAEAMDKAAQEWLAELDHFDKTLEEMAAATLDQDFKDELSAIEQWFKVLSEAERTAALYALIQQTTQVQIRFFITVLQQMSKSHPMSAMLSPANFEKDPMTNRMSDAMSKLSMEGNRNSFARPAQSSGLKRNSVLEPGQIEKMFPDAAAAIASQRAMFAQQTVNGPGSNRNSSAFEHRPPSLITPTISTPLEGKENVPTWGNRETQPIARPKSSSDQQPMGQFIQLPGSAGIRSPAIEEPTIRSTTLTSTALPELPAMSPYGASSWASMTNTPMVPTFNATQIANNHAEHMANATAMRLAALSTTANRQVALDDAKKYRRRPNEPTPPPGVTMPVSPGLGAMAMNENAAAAYAAMQQSALGRRSPRPNSPGIALHGAQFGAGFISPQQNGFLNVYDGGLMAGTPGLVPAGYPGSHDGYLSDHSDIHGRGRSPRGRRATSKPPEDPTDPSLLQDIPAWLRSLRLHKYTDNLKDLSWTELVELDDDALEKRGVNALGARRKMLKVFEQVKEAKAEAKA